MRAIERHDSASATVVPVILRPVDDWMNVRLRNGSTLGKLQALPKDAKPVTSFRDRDAGWSSVVAGIRKVVEWRQTGISATGGSVPMHSAPGPQTLDPQIASFARISIDGQNGYWAEESPVPAGRYITPVSQYFHETQLVKSSPPPTFDITVINNGKVPLVASTLGVEIVYASQVTYVYGIPRAARIPILDYYSIEMPNLRNITEPQQNSWGEVPWLRFDIEVSRVLPDPIYMPSKAPFRFHLELAKYGGMLNEVILNIWLLTDVGRLRSAPLYLHKH